MQRWVRILNQEGCILHEVITGHAPPEADVHIEDFSEQELLCLF